MNGLNLRETRYRVGAGVLVLAVLSVAFIVRWGFVSQELAETRYTYEEIAIGSQLNLHVMRTQPQHIRLVSIGQNVTESGMNGINGGYFWGEQQLSIAVENDRPVHGERGEYGSGWFNVKYPRGTLVFDAEAKVLSVQVAGSADDIQVTDRSRYWAQGGVSMKLSEDEIWEEAIEEEALPFPDDHRLRSAIVYDREGHVYLIVSSVKCTIGQFRHAIQNHVAPGKLVDGVFLDGDGSSQMLADQVKLAGDGRKVLQMIAVQP